MYFMAGPIFDRFFAILSFSICIGLEFKGWVAVKGNLFKCFSTEMDSLNKRLSFSGKPPRGVKREEEKQKRKTV